MCAVVEVYFYEITTPNEFYKHEQDWKCPETQCFILDWQLYA